MSALTGSEEETEEALVDDIAVQNDGKLVIATPVGLWRRNRDGAVDSGFGAGGLVACDPDPGSEFFHLTPFSLVAATADAKLVAAGGAGRLRPRSLPGQRRPRTRLRRRRKRRPLRERDRPARRARFPPRRSLILAEWDRGSGALRLARYTQAGQLDPGFGAGGVATWAPASPG